MNVFKQLGILFSFCFLGECMARLLPVKLPASVWGIALLFTAFCVKLLRPETLAGTAEFLLKNMGIFFLPPSIAIIEQFGLLKSSAVLFFVICIATTVITFFVTYITVRGTRILIQKIKGTANE